MSTIYSKLKNNYFIILILCIYLIVGIILINNYQYQFNSDGISYINIAQKYMDGDISNAINGYWGPLLSWLLIPFLYFSTNPISSAYFVKLLLLITGFFTIIGIKLLVSNFEIEKTIERLMLISLIPIVLYFAFYITTPDLLSLCLIIYYLYFIFNSKYPESKFYGLMCGITGALAFLTKSFALPFFLVHFILFNTFFYFKSLNQEKRRKILKNFSIGIIVFFAISGIWIGLISDKYDKITFGTSGEYNHELVGPKSQGHYEFYHGLVELPNNSSFSSWEDPSYFKMESWSPFQSFDYFMFQIDVILKNIVKIISIIELYSVLSIVILIAAIALIIKSRANGNSKKKLIYLLATILIYAGGYTPLILEERYLWIVSILLLITGCYVLSLLLEMNYINKFKKNILIIFLILSFIMTPISILVSDFNGEQGIYNLSQTLKNKYNVHGNIASNDKLVDSDHIVFLMNGKYYAMPKKTNNYNEKKAELENYNIDYYLVWGESKENDYFSKYFKEVTNGTIKNLRVYSLKS